MEESMKDLRSEELYDGIFPLSMLDSSARLCHVRDDGMKFPVLFGFDDPDDDADDDDADKDDIDDDDKDKDDDDDDDDEDDPDKIKDPKRRRAARQAASYRNQRNVARQERDALKTEVTDLKAKLAAAEKSGAGDETLKTTITALETELAEVKGKLAKAEESGQSVSIDRQISDALKDSKEKFKEEPDLIRYHLERANLLTLDESGEIEDLDRSIRRLKRQGKITVVSDDDEDDDDDDGASGSKKSSGRTMNSKKKGTGSYDRAALEKQYPALRGR